MLCCWVVGGLVLRFEGCFAVLLVILLRLCCFGARFADLPEFASFLWADAVWVLDVLLDFWVWVAFGCGVWLMLPGGFSYFGGWVW